MGSLQWSSVTHLGHSCALTGAWHPVEHSLTHGTQLCTQTSASTSNLLSSPTHNGGQAHACCCRYRPLKDEYSKEACRSRALSNALGSEGDAGTSALYVLLRAADRFYGLHGRCASTALFPLCEYGRCASTCSCGWCGKCVRLASTVLHDCVAGTLLQHRPRARKIGFKHMLVQQMCQGYFCIFDSLCGGYASADSMASSPRLWCSCRCLCMPLACLQRAHGSLLASFSGCVPLLLQASGCTPPPPTHTRVWLRRLRVALGPAWAAC